MRTFLLLVALCVALANAAPNCEAEKKKADSCAKQMYFLMDPDFRAIRHSDLTAYCNKVDEQIKCVQDYGKNCLKGFTKQTLTIGLHGMKKHYKSICGAKATLQDKFIENIDWITEDANKEVYTCASASIKNMIHIADNVKTDDQIPQACCSYWLSRQCLTQKLSKLTSDPKRIFMEKMTDDAMTNLIEFLCSKQNSIATCKQLMPEAMPKLQKAFTDVKKSERNSKESYLIPFLDVVSDK